MPVAKEHFIVCQLLNSSGVCFGTFFKLHTGVVEEPTALFSRVDQSGNLKSHTLDLCLIVRGCTFSIFP
jgi:hypothetical protein